MTVEIINAAAFFAFLVLLAAGAGATLSRVVFYRLNGFRLPRLLIRDAHVLGGFALSFGLVSAVRVLRAFGADISGLATNPIWAFAVAAPAVWAIAVYAYYEIAVIERGANHGSAQAYLERESPHRDRES